MGRGVRPGETGRRFGPPRRFGTRATGAHRARTAGAHSGRTSGTAAAAQAQIAAAGPGDRRHGVTDDADPAGNHLSHRGARAEEPGWQLRPDPPNILGAEASPQRHDAQAAAGFGAATAGRFGAAAIGGPAAALIE